LEYDGAAPGVVAPVEREARETTVDGSDIMLAGVPLQEGVNKKARDARQGLSTYILECAFGQLEVLIVV
jgi:hypothetical protein